MAQGKRSTEKAIRRILGWILTVVLALAGFLTPYAVRHPVPSQKKLADPNRAVARSVESSGSTSFTWSPQDGVILKIPEYNGKPSITLHGSRPFFESSDFRKSSYKKFSSFDSLGRCGTAIAQIGPDLMPTEPRGKIGMVKPSGWHTVRYDDLIRDKYLYNRCHLIGYQLCGENANEENLITGTRYLNVTGMEPYEIEVADYVMETGNAILYRVTPVFLGDELVARGVLMEAESVKDRGRSLHFCVYCYNVQPGVAVDYATGESARTQK